MRGSGGPPFLHARLAGSNAGTTEVVRSTNGANRNGFRATAQGDHATCYVRTHKGWIPLTRDWTAR